MRKTNNFIYTFLFIISGVLLISCATRPALPVQAAVPPGRESILFFERALENIKMNAPLVTKNIESVPGETAGIIIKGEFQIDGNKFRVIYDLAGARISRDNKNIFCIPFYMEDLTNGVSHTDELFWSPGADKSGLLLSFDDDYWRNWQDYFDMFDIFGARATFFIQGSPVSGGGGLLNFCGEALRRGHSLGYHSINHYDLTKVSRETFNSETIEAAKSFLGAGIPFSAFAFPFGFSETWMGEALAPVFSVTRGYGVNPRFYPVETAGSGYIISKAIDNIIYPDDSRFEDDIRMILLAAKFTGNIIVPLTTHSIEDRAQWGIKPRRLEYLLKTAREMNLIFYTYDVFANMRQ